MEGDPVTASVPMRVHTPTRDRLQELAAEVGISMMDLVRILVERHGEGTIRSLRGPLAIVPRRVRSLGGGEGRRRR